MVIASGIAKGLIPLYSDTSPYNDVTSSCFNCFNRQNMQGFKFGLTNVEFRWSKEPRRNQQVVSVIRQP